MRITSNCRHSSSSTSASSSKAATHVAFEVLVRAQRIAGDAEDAAADRQEIGVEVAELLASVVSSRGAGLRIEAENERSAALGWRGEGAPPVAGRVKSATGLSIIDSSIDAAIVGEAMPGSTWLRSAPLAPYW